MIEIFKSDKPEKKYYAKFINPMTNREYKVYFGDSAYEDYTTHHDLTRKKNYLARHKNDSNSIYSAGFYAKNLLWNLPTIQESIQSFPYMISRI